MGFVGSAVMRRPRGRPGSGARSAPAPARSGGSRAGSAAAISCARSSVGESSGCARYSRAAAAAARAAAIAVPPATAAFAPTVTVSALLAAATSGLARPPADGPSDVNGDACVAGSSLRGPRSHARRTRSPCRA